MRINELTTFRFIAAAIVVIFHFGKEATGFSGILVAGPEMVTFFFVLSGFVLGVSYFNKDMKKLRFWWERAARITPMYFIGLLMMILLSIIQGREIDPLAVVLNFSFLQSWIYPYSLSVNPPGWSLSVEAFFYLLFPFIFYIFKIYNLSNVKVVVLSATTWMLTQIILIVVLTKEVDPDSLLHHLVYYFPISHYCSFLMGVSGAVLLINKRYLILNNMLSIVLVFSIIYLVVFSINNRAQLSNLIGMNLAFGSSFFSPLFLVLIMGVSICRSNVMKILSLRPLVLLGEASFSIYILQVPLHEIYVAHISGQFSFPPAVDFAAYFCFLTAISIVCFLCIEKPANKYLRYSFPGLIRKRLFSKAS
ncbi:MAG: acyltransferase [Methylococcales bacterium]